jgi:hypothetical protein
MPNIARKPPGAGRRHRRILSERLQRELGPAKTLSSYFSLQISDRIMFCHFKPPTWW